LIKESLPGHDITSDRMIGNVVKTAVTLRFLAGGSYLDLASVWDVFTHGKGKNI
jgi:hypothetical protein